MESPRVKITAKKGGKNPSRYQATRDPLHHSSVQADTTFSRDQVYKGGGTIGFNQFNWLQPRVNITTLNTPEDASGSRSISQKLHTS